MERTIEWLIGIERMAHLLYAQAAKLFEDPAIKVFLEQAAEDERQHMLIMKNALTVARQHPQWLSAVLMDQDAMRNIENTFKRSHQKLNAGSLTIASLVDCMVQTELSEWNQVFTYVVDTLKEIVPEFKGVAAGMQHHLVQMRHFLEAHAYGTEKIEALNALHPVWRENILIVDDSEAVLDLLVTVLNKDGRVATAQNGKIGLEKIRNTYYQLIISDVDMPVMDGLEFFQRATSEYPGIQDRFVFFTGDPSPQSLAFFQKHQLKYLTKPATIQQIRSLYLQSLRKLSMTA